MSDRVVMLGPLKEGRVQAREVSPNDAAAFVNDGHWRVFLSLYSGVLANATVLQHVTLWCAETPAQKRAHEKAWQGVEIMTPRGRAFWVDAPIPLAECGVS